MKYQTNKERITSFMDKIVLPALKKFELDYGRVFTKIKIETGATDKQIEDIIKLYIQTGKIKEHRILTIPDEQVQDWLDDLIRKEKEDKLEAEKEAIEILSRERIEE